MSLLKKISTALLLCSTLAINAQDIGASTDWTKNWVNYTPQKRVSFEGTKTLPAMIEEDMVLSNSEIHLIKGNVYVESGATLTIEPGTVLLGDVDTKGTLIVSKGASIVAKSSLTRPIVFTSSHGSGQRKAGDWGGIIVMGSDNNINTLSGTGVVPMLETKYNVYGGEGDVTTTSVLEHVLVEYAGGGKRAGITLAGKSNIEMKNVQVSYSAHNGYDFIGGALETSQLIAFNNLEDDFCFTNGFQGKLSNIVALKNDLHSGHSPVRAAANVTNSMETNLTDPSKTPTTVVLDQVTFLKANTGIPVPNSFDGIYLDGSAIVKVSNSLIQNFQNSVEFKTINSYKERFSVENVVMNSLGDAFSTKSNNDVEALTTFYNEQNKVTEGAYINYVKNDTGKKGLFDLKYDNPVDNVSGR